jgi:hypothetical protein
MIFSSPPPLRALSNFPLNLTFTFALLAQK